MSSSRYPDNNRYPRDRSPYRENRDRRPSGYGGGYAPRGNDSNNRPNPDSNTFQPRDAPRGPKSLDVPRGPPIVPASGVPSGPRDIPREAPRGFAGRGEPPSLRDAPPLGTHNYWRPERDHFDRRDRRPSPPRRSPVRDARDSRDFVPRDLDINRARRNSRDGPPSAGSTYSDPPLGIGSNYRGRGRGGIGRDFGGDTRGRGRAYHIDDRDRHDARDRMPDRPDRAYNRPRSRSRDSIRRDRDIREERDFDRRDRDEQRFNGGRIYDSYIGPGSAIKPGMRSGLDTHRGNGPADSRHVPGTPTGPPTPHSSHHPSTGDRLGPPPDAYPRRSSIAVEPLSAKDARRESEQNNLLAIRAEASRERYAPRASSPPAAVPAFGFSNVWRNPALDAKPSVVAHALKPVQPTASVAVASTLAPPTTIPANATVPKPSVPSGPSTAPITGPKVPPTGPKADRISDRSQGDHQSQDNRPSTVDRPRVEPPSRPPPLSAISSKAPVLENIEQKSVVPVAASAPSSALIPPQPLAISPPPPLGPASRIRAPPTGPQATLRQNVSPSFSRPPPPPPPPPPYVPRDVSPVTAPSSITSRNPMSVNTSPKSMPANIPTGPKADRTNPMVPRPQMYGPMDRPGFSTNSNFAPPRLPMAPFPKSHQWVKPGLNRVPSIPTKREFSGEDRERTFGTAPKAPKLEGATTAMESQRMEQPIPKSPATTRSTSEAEVPRIQVAPEPVAKAPSPKPTEIDTRGLSNLSLPDESPRTDKLPVSAASSAHEMMEDSDDDLDLDEDDFAESEAKYNKEQARLVSKRVDLSAPHLRANTPLREIMLLASLTIDHLPHQQTKPVDEEMISPPLVQPPPESAPTELLTPKAEEAEDMIVDGKQEKPLAPATQALRLRHDTSPEQEPEPDLSCLPYLGSGPPTPLSDLEQDRPSLSDWVILTIRNNLRKDIEPELDPDDVSKQYAIAYKQWRLHIRDFDDTQDAEEERQPSIDPGLKVTTPDPQNSAMAAVMMDQPTTGRRGHSGRWATELDFEQVLKESLKTAEEERMGKKEKEPRKSMSDPEREANVPMQLTAYDAQRRRFIDTNFQREPGQGIFVYHYEPPEDDFTEAEHKIMVSHYKDQYAKKWGKLAEILYKEAGTSRTYKDCINHYYATKWHKEYKGKVRGKRGGARKRGGGAGRGRANNANTDRTEVPGEDGSIPHAVTETGRPRRSAAPTFGAESEFDASTSTPTPGRPRRQPDADGNQEKVDRRRKTGKEKAGRKPKNQVQVLAAAPAESPVKIDRKERALGVKTEEDFGRRSLGEMPLPMQTQLQLGPSPDPGPGPSPGPVEDPTPMPSNLLVQPGMGVGMSERSRPQTNNTRPGPSSYWSVTEQNDFQRNVAHFGTDWIAIANHMGTKTHTMVRNQYLRLAEGGTVPELQKLADEADQKRERGEDLGPPPTPTPAPKRRYESAQTNIPRTLAPTPEVAELLKSPAMVPVAAPKESPPQFVPSGRLSTIAQAPIQAKPLVTTPGTISMSEPGLVAVPSVPQHSPPVQPPRTQPQVHHQQSLSQHKAHHPGPHAGPRAGFFSDELVRAEARPPSQSSMAQPARSIQQQIQPQGRAQEQPQAQLFRSTGIQEREGQSRLEVQADNDPQLRFQPHHSRRISHEVPPHRHFPTAMTGAAPMMSQMRSTPGARSPESRPLSMQHPRHVAQPQSSGQSQIEVANQPSTSLPVASQYPSRSSMATPPIKDEHRQFSLPQHQPQRQPQHQPHVQTQSYPPLSTQSPVPPPASKPTTAPRKSNLLSLLNDTEPEELRPKKSVEQGIISHTPTPLQQTPIAPPPPTAPQALPPQRDTYIDVRTTQAPYSRSSYAQPAPMPQPPSSRHFVDLTSEQSQGARATHQRESWQRGHHFHTSQSQTQPGSALNSPHSTLAQPMFGGDSRMYGNHRSLLAQHNAPRHNPSPPPLSAYNNSPHMHSRTPSLSGATSQQSRHGLSNTTPTQHPQAAGSTQILQPNPYAQVDPPGSSSQASGPVGMRPSPHLHTSHVAHARDLQGRNEQSQVHNGTLNYPNPHVLSENHAGHQHIRGPSVSEQYRGRDPRDIQHEFDARNAQRDMSMELSQRADALLREQAESLMGTSQHRSTAPLPPQQDHRYQPQQQDRSYVQRSHTPLSRTEHNQHQPLQHPPHSSLAENSHPIYGQRPPEEPRRFRTQFHPQNERERFPDRMREEQAQQHPGLGVDEYAGREREMRERDMQRDARYREDLMRRERETAARGAPPLGPGQHAPDQRQVSDRSSMDWTRAVRPPPPERWQQQQR
ncbi:hypothetical protein K504DRAFT_365471 [Pleomassaria siparia CBS 279.74]|uniref:Myb-like domain-containing protein n=1 Tax=Pleomassaria siparia CBS 279.74 TaxID=1314801 RepID=A0A6G1KR75_9PLEO|nr:hypothetical protein K504DRAFT_365471 [Pleomassaria siparia CBS 279.74]